MKRELLKVSILFAVPLCMSVMVLAGAERNDAALAPSGANELAADLVDGVGQPRAIANKDAPAKNMRPEHVTGTAGGQRQCELECPPGATAENEPDCGHPYDTVNGGCLVDPAIFSPISCGETVCGTAEFNGSTRDTDWYEVVIDEPMMLTLTVEAEFDVVVGLLEQVVLGVPGCGNITGYISPYADLDECVEGSVVTACLWPGTYYWFIGPNFEGPTFACGADYIATLTCSEPCTLPTGACCMRDGSCGDDVEEWRCMAEGGTYQGDWIECATVVCPQPQPGDYCPMPLPLTLPADLPYNDISQQNCGRLNDYDDTCLNTFDGGEEIIYELTVTSIVNVKITLDPKTTEYTGALLDDSCPPDLDCISKSTSWVAAVHDLGCKHLEPGTYYVMVDTWPAPYCIPEFDLSIEECIPPTGRCCYDPWPTCTDGITEWVCQTTYPNTKFTADLNCIDHPCPMEVPESCAEVFVIGSVPYDVLIDNDESTADGPAASCDPYSATDNMRNDGWFAWTADDNCFGEMTVTADDYDAVMVTWEGPDCDNLVEVNCVDTPEPLVQQFAATTGTTYWFQMGDTGMAEDGGLTTVELTCSDVGSGACCFDDGSCSVVAAAVDCVNTNGFYWGEGTVCDPNPCPQPEPGDDCDIPIHLTLPADGIPYTDVNTTCGHGNDYDNTCLGSYDGGEDIIYELTLTEDRCLDIRVHGDSPGWLTTGVAIDTTCPPGGTCLAFDTDLEGEMRLIVELVAGTYYIMVDTWPSPICMDFTLTIDDCPPLPENDDCTQAAKIGDVTALPFDTSRATFDGGGNCMDSPNIWYCYTADYTGSIDVSLCGSTYDTKLAIYDGCTCSPLGAELGCNDDYDCPGEDDLQSQIDGIRVRAGQSYMIEVGGHSDKVGPGELTISCDPDPLGRCCYDPWPSCIDSIAELDCQLIYGGWFREGLNCIDDPCPDPFAEDCDSAIVIAEMPHSTTIDNADATADGPAASCDPYGAGGNMKNDAWYAWTADADCFGEITVTTDDYDVIMVIWQGPDCDNLVEIGCVYNSLLEPLVFQWAAVTGTTYWFQIGDPGGAEGGGLTTIEITCTDAGTGACCFEDGACSVMAAVDCINTGGFYWGEGTDCDPNPCPQPASGDNCDSPLGISLPGDGIPYVDAHNTTCGHGNDYEDTCLDDYDQGEDIIYELTLTYDLCLDISVDSICCGWICAGIALDNVCPPSDPCLEYATDFSGDPSMQVSLTAGTYYLMFDNWPSPTCVEDFTLTITTCEPPIPGDFDYDGDVDLDDYAAFADCMGGPDVPPDPQSPEVSQMCLNVFDFDSDVDVDLADFAVFQAIFTE
ncbi:MAG: hypothetical protein KAV82_00145 [Phycisphaerae bacterium]|nr:hypothetical protein [Phycisphaerae bacterium]